VSEARRCDRCRLPLHETIDVATAPLCRVCAAGGLRAWKYPEAHRPAADEAGREALDAPQQEFEPAAKPSD